MSVLLDSLLGAWPTLPLGDAAGLAPARQHALHAVQADGLPGARAEAWKYTSLRALERRAFAPSLFSPTLDAGALELPPAPRIAFVNGHFDAALSDLSGLPDGVRVQPLSQALQAGDAREVDFLARRYDGRDDAFARVNAALAVEGVLLRADAGGGGDVAIHLLLLGAPGIAGDVAWHLRHLVELRDGARVTLVEHRVGIAPHAHLENEIAHVHLGRGAQLRHARIQAEADGATTLLRTDAVLAGEAEYRRVDLELGAAMSRHEFNVALQGRHARLRSNGALLAGGRRHLDTRLGIDHVAPDTRCELIWRGLGAGRGRAVFHGGIVVRAGADGSDAMLSNKNLLLSEGASIDTQPVLEIHADEVRAAHGATVGQLDPNALFYLRSRGLAASDARAMLTAAFCREVLDVFGDGAPPAALQRHLDAALAALDRR